MSKHQPLVLTHRFQGLFPGSFLLCICMNFFSKVPFFKNFWSLIGWDSAEFFLHLTDCIGPQNEGNLPFSVRARIIQTQWSSPFQFSKQRHEVYSNKADHQLERSWRDGLNHHRFPEILRNLPRLFLFSLGVSKFWNRKCNEVQPSLEWFTSENKATQVRCFFGGGT